MKKVLVLFDLCGAIVFALSFLFIPDFNTFLYKQLAAVIGIDIDSVRQWQQQKGLQRNLAIGDRGEDVRLLQEGLNKMSLTFPAKNGTGYYGQKTAKAVSDFQMAHGLSVNGRLDADTRSLVNDLYFNELCPSQRNAIYPDEILIHVNRTTLLPSGYIPHNLTRVPDSMLTLGVVCVKQDVVPFLEQMFDDAASQRISLIVTSGFRRPEIQSIIYKIWQRIEGDTTRDGVAEPSHSEHQLGTTVDLSGRSINYSGADDAFGGTAEDAWLTQHAHQYGFVMSYPKGKTSVTGYQYEPWHYRFVGIEAAKEIFDARISVEEYLNSRAAAAAARGAIISF